MIEIQISKAAYDTEVTIAKKFQDILNVIGGKLSLLGDDLKPSKIFSKATIASIDTDSLEHFDADEFAIIATDPKGDIIGGTYLMTMAASKLTEEVPTYMSDREIKDEDDKVIGIYTRAQYLTGDGDFEVEGTYYFNASHNQNAFSFTEVKQLLADGYVLMGKAERISKRPETEV